MRRDPVLDQQQNVKAKLELFTRLSAVPWACYSTLPIFFTAAISRVLSAATNAENAGAS